MSGFKEAMKRNADLMSKVMFIPVMLLLIPVHYYDVDGLVIFVQLVLLGVQVWATWFVWYSPGGREYRLGRRA